MITQYTGGYSSVPSDIQAIVNGRVSLLDRYILFRTGEYQYTALVQNSVTGDVRQFVFSRSSNNGFWSVSEGSVSGFDYQVSNQYYVVSNVGLGRQLDLFCWRGATAWGLTFVTCVLCFWILFKGVLFGWRKKS